MDSWKYNDGILKVQLDDGSFYYPKAIDIASMLSKTSATRVEVESQYPSLKSSGLSLSKIGKDVHISLFLDQLENIRLCLSVFRRNERYSVSAVDGLFLDYIIIEKTLYFLTGSFAQLNDYLTSNKISLKNISVQSYLKIRSFLEQEHISYEDKVSEQLKFIQKKCSEKETVLNGLTTNLYPYQTIGVSWMKFMEAHGCGCILGDEMGLGKTLQIIALLGYLKSVKSSFHALIICPMSLLENWRRELFRFYPSLQVLVHHGSSRTGFYGVLLEFDVVIMSYSNVESDLGMLQSIEWDVVALDEAQNIKNPEAKRTRAVKELNKKIGIAISGTPFENHMSDIWSITDFVIPEYMGSLNEFNALFSDDVSSAKLVEFYLSPLMIRRKAKDVLTSLPPRVDIPQPIQMNHEEAVLYETSARTKAKDLSLKSRKLEIIQLLRLFCTHPFVYDKNISIQDPKLVSTKYTRLCEILDEIFMQKEKVIIFTSFHKMIEIMVNDLKKRFGVYTDYIDGSVAGPERQKKIDLFSQISGAAVLVLNPSAAGVGLNITAANHVIHYNLEWNPAKEDQASARAYRNGQNKTVFIYRLYYIDTIEEFINDKIQLKKDINGNAIVGNNGENDLDDLKKILDMSPIGRTL